MVFFCRCSGYEISEFYKYMFEDVKMLFDCFLFHCDRSNVLVYLLDFRSNEHFP